jgi:tetratricopeptide (TPR) repeat protein
VRRLVQAALAAAVLSLRAFGAQDDGAELTLHVEKTVQLELDGRSMVLTPGESDYKLPRGIPIAIRTGQALLRLGSEVFRAHAGDSFEVRLVGGALRLTVLSGRIDAMSPDGRPLAVRTSDTLTLTPEAPGKSAATGVDRGIELMDQGHLQQAIWTLEREVKNDPGSAKALMNLGWAYWRARRLDESRRCWSTLVELDPTNPTYLRMLAGVEIERKNYSKGLELSQKALQLLPGDRDATLVMARSLAFLGRDDESMKILRGMPDEPAVRFQMGELQVRKGRLPEALQTFAALVKANPLNADYRRQHAKVLFDMGKADDAVKEWRKLADGRPPDIPSLEDLAKVYWRNGRFDDSYNAWSRLAQLDPTNLEYLRMLAGLELQRRDYKRALSLTEDALRVDPENRDTILLRARALAKLGRSPEALQIIGRIIEEHPEQTDARLQVADVLLEMGRLDDAMIQFDILQKVSPNDWTFRKRRAAAWFAFGQFEKSLAEWQQIAEAQPKDPEPLMNEGWCYLRLSRVDDAWRVWSILASMEPNNPSFMRLLADIEIERKNYGKAQVWSEKALEHSPFDRQTLLVLARSLVRQQKMEEAKAVYRKVIREEPGNVSARFQLAALLMREDKLEEALAQIDALLAIEAPVPMHQKLKAQILYELARFDEAISIWTDLATRQPADVEAIDRLSDDAYLRNDWPTVYKWLQVKAAVAPLDPASFLRLAKASEMLGKYHEGLQAADAAADLDPASTEGLYVKAEIYEKLQDWNNAHLTYLEVMRRNPNSRLGWMSLEWNAEARRDTPEAIDMTHKVEETFTGRTSSSPIFALQEARLLADAGNAAGALEIAEDVKRLHPKGIPVLLYHGISRTDRAMAVPRRLFREQMAALHRAGYRSIDAEEYVRYIQGDEPIEGKPILITFDDARVDSLRYGDPILKEFGFKAVMFVHLVGVRKGMFHASLDQLRKWQDTGRWDMQSHGDDAHIYIVVDAEGHKGHFLASRMWLPNEKRVETVAEFRKRVEADMRNSKEVLEKAFNKKIIAYAFPFSDFGQSDTPNNPHAAWINQVIVRRYYQVAFIQDARGYNDPTSDPGEMTRFEVPRDMPGDELARRLAVGPPAVQVELAEARIWNQSGQPERALEISDRLASQGVDTPEVWAVRGQALQKLGDPYSARDLYSKASSIYPTEPSYQKMLKDAEHDAAPSISSSFDAFGDNSDRRVTRAVMRIDGSVRAFGLGGWYGWGPSSEPNAPRITTEERGLDLRLPVTARSQFTFDYIRRQFSAGTASKSDNWQGAGSVILLPGVKASGNYVSDHLTSAAAASSGISFHNYGGQLEWAPAMQWSFYGRYDYWRYSDGNLRNDVRLQATRTISNGVWPVSLGYMFWSGDSTKPNPSTYWTPVGLNEHLGLATLSRSSELFEGRLEAGAGVGTQADGARFVQILNASMRWRVLDYLSWTLGAGFQHTPSYRSQEIVTGLGLTY